MYYNSPKDKEGMTNYGKKTGKKQQRRRLRKKRSLLGLSVLVVLCAGYLLTCSMAEKNTIIDGVQVNGTEVGGLTTEQAADRIQKAFEEEYADAALTVSANGVEYQVAMAPCLSMDVESAAEKAMDYGHGSFLTRGAALLKAKIFGQDVTQHPQVGDEAKLMESIDASGLSAINTTVQTT